MKVLKVDDCPVHVRGLARTIHIVMTCTKDIQFLRFSRNACESVSFFSLLFSLLGSVYARFEAHFRGKRPLKIMG